MSSLTALAAALAASLAFAAGPALALPAAAAAPTDAPPCASVSGYELTPQEAERLLQAARELVASLATVIDDPRSTALGDQLRSLGITPAVDTGWRQQAHDLADSLVTQAETEPQAQRALDALSEAGIFPTPADLRRTSAADQPAPFTETTTGASGPLLSALRRLSHIEPSERTRTGADTGTDSGIRSGTQPADTQTTCSTAPEPVPPPAADAKPPRTSPGSGQPPATDPAAAGEGNSESLAPTGTREDESAVSPAEPEWEQIAADLSTDLAAASDDPDAVELASKLESLDTIPTSGADTQPRPDHRTRTTPKSPQHERDLDGTDQPAATAAAARPVEDTSTSASATTDEGGWERDAQELAVLLADAGEADPAVAAITSALHAAGITTPDTSGPGSGSATRAEEPPTAPAAPVAPSATGDQPPAARPDPDPSAGDTAAAAVWDLLAKCEASGDWAVNTGNGYYGVIRTDQGQDDADHCPSGLGGVLSGIWTKISAVLLSRSVSS